MKSYKSIEEWYSDLKVVRENPNDEAFVQHVAAKVNNSPEELRRQIKKEMYYSIYEKQNDYKYILSLMNETESKFLIINSEEFPWFEV